jgi:hypothetical protein
VVRPPDADPVAAAWGVAIPENESRHKEEIARQAYRLKIALIVFIESPSAGMTHGFHTLQMIDRATTPQKPNASRTSFPRPSSLRPTDWADSCLHDHTMLRGRTKLDY